MKTFNRILHPANVLIVATGFLTACASTGGYTNTVDDGYGKKQVKAVTAEPAENKIVPPLISVDTAIGQVIAAGPDSKTLYYFDKDTPNTSTCYDGCAAAWPPFLVTDPARAIASLTIVERNDGNKQWAINGKPVYFWAGDQKAGDTTGSAIPDWTVVTADSL